MTFQEWAAVAAAALGAITMVAGLIVSWKPTRLKHIEEREHPSSP
jgi:hypothetical protein